MKVGDEYMGIHYTIHSTLDYILNFLLNKFKKRIKSYYVDLLATPGSPNLPQRKGTKKNIRERHSPWILSAGTCQTWCGE